MLKAIKHLFNLLTGPEYGRERSPKWETVRNNFIRSNPACAVCGDKTGVEAHHIRPFHKYPELELSPGNLITLCRTHHLLFGHLMDWQSYNLTVREDCLVWQHKIQKRPKE